MYPGGGADTGPLVIGVGIEIFPGGKYRHASSFCRREDHSAQKAREACRGVGSGAGGGEGMGRLWALAAPETGNPLPGTANRPCGGWAIDGGRGTLGTDISGGADPRGVCCWLSKFRRPSCATSRKRPGSHPAISSKPQSPSEIEVMSKHVPRRRLSRSLVVAVIVSNQVNIRINHLRSSVVLLGVRMRRASNLATPANCALNWATPVSQTWNKQSINRVASTESDSL